MKASVICPFRTDADERLHVEIESDTGTDTRRLQVLHDIGVIPLNPHGACVAWTMAWAPRRAVEAGGDHAATLDASGAGDPWNC
jgi:hypothetical protein